MLSTEALIVLKEELERSVFAHIGIPVSLTLEIGEGRRPETFKLCIHSNALPLNIPLFKGVWLTNSGRTYVTAQCESKGTFYVWLDSHWESHGGGTNGSDFIVYTVDYTTGKILKAKAAWLGDLNEI